MKIGRKTIALGLLTLAIILFFGAWLVITSGTSDFKQFILDRRFTAGLAGPDPAATCQYDFEDGQLLVTRKSRGHKKLHAQELSGTPRDFNYAGQNVVIAGDGILQTYNCANQEFLTHKVIGGDGQIKNVAFSTNGKNVAVWERDPRAKVDFVEVFSFAKNPNKSVWNKGLGGDPDSVGVTVGQITAFKLLGQSLVWASKTVSPEQKKGGAQGKAAGRDGLFLFVYNFRKGHAKSPYNPWDPEAAPYLVKGELVKEPAFDAVGQTVEVEIADGGATTNYYYDFSCRLKDTPIEPAFESGKGEGGAQDVVADQDAAGEDDSAAKKKPCLWQKRSS